MNEIATLDHEIFDLQQALVPHRYPRSQITYHSMKFASLVALGLSLGILALASAKLTEILRGSWGDIGKQLHFHST